MEGNNILKNKYYKRPWGKHKNGHYALIYNSGSYGELIRVLEGRIIYNKIVLLKCTDGSIDDAKWAEEHNFVLSKMEE